MKIELSEKANEIIAKEKSKLIDNGKQSVAYVSGMQFALTNLELLTAQYKDIAIGFNQWQVSFECDYWWSAKRNMWIKYGLDNISITTEQLFNEYLNTL